MSIAYYSSFQDLENSNILSEITTSKSQLIKFIGKNEFVHAQYIHCSPRWLSRDWENQVNRCNLCIIIYCPLSLKFCFIVFDEVEWVCDDGYTTTTYLLCYKCEHHLRNYAEFKHFEIDISSIEEMREKLNNTNILGTYIYFYGEQEVEKRAECLDKTIESFIYVVRERAMKEYDRFSKLFETYLNKNLSKIVFSYYI